MSEKIPAYPSGASTRPDDPGRVSNRPRRRSPPPAVGVVCVTAGGFPDGFVSTVQRRFADAMAEAGFVVRMMPGTSLLPDLLRAIETRRIDGLLLITPDALDLRAAALYVADVPFVRLGHSDIPVPSVDADTYRGGFMATQHLLEWGHRRIAYLPDPSGDRAGDRGRSGYEDALTGFSAELMPMVWTNEGLMEQGHHVSGGLFAAGCPVSAIVASSDRAARMVIRQARAAGLRVPDDLSVVGYGDTPLAEEVSPGLTTVAESPEALGKALARLLVTRLTGLPAETVLVAPQLVVRGSTRHIAVGRPRAVAHPPLVIKAGPAFALWSGAGMVDPSSPGSGLFVADTHRLDTYVVRVNRQEISPAAVAVRPDGFTMRYVVSLAGGTVELERRLELTPNGLTDGWTWRRWGARASWVFELEASPDFRDVFQLRGATGAAGGVRRSRLAADGGESHTYLGSDGIDRRLDLVVSPVPTQNQLGVKAWEWGSSEAAGRVDIRLEWELPREFQPPSVRRVTPELAVTVENPDWQAALARGRSDLRLLATDFGSGPVFTAGLPWFGTLFGRDALLSAYEVLQFSPEWAYATLLTLARYQGREDRPERAEARGKIVHEVRFGEWTNLGVLPYGRYYGSVDVTPLYLTVLAAWWRRTADRAGLERLLPAAEEALAWLVRAIEGSSDGLVWFRSEATGGLVVQSWKDSADSMVHADGRRAKAPLAVAEVQGYVYQALCGMAALYRDLNRTGEAADLGARATRLAERFQAAFWMEDLGYYAMAIDGAGHGLRVLSSDPGHCLWSGIVGEPWSGAVADRLLGPELWSGWGIRTLGADERAYDPYSYHRGTVWPHDTALAVAGLAARGQHEAARVVAAGLMAAASRLPFHRLPEVFSGVPRGSGDEGPLPYPGACSPQAWAAGAPWLIVQSLLGFEVDAVARTVRVGPAPPEMGRVTVEGPLLGHHGEITACLAVTVDAGGVVASELPSGWRLDARQVASARPADKPESEA